MRENPFPDYPVVRLKADASTVGHATIVTPAIKAARDIVDRYVMQWLARKEDSKLQIEPIITAVRGDYGTGKTHLLLDAAAYLQDALGTAYPNLKLIRVACLETDPLTWFRLSIGPELKPLTMPTQIESKSGFIERLMLRLYAAAGRAVAGQTKLTEGAIERLVREPEAIRTLVKENLLNVSVVDEEFSLLLQKTCSEVSENVRRALAGTIWVDTAALALRWLAGEPLSESERNLLHVSQELLYEEDAAGILLALAAVNRVLETPFVLMFDELEHLTRYDQSQQGKRNITWLKRLLEGLATHQALTFVSGHWSAWEAQNDYLDRFSGLRPIELLKLTSTDVLNIVLTRVPDISNVPPEIFSETQAEAIVQSTDGNIRRVLTLCRVLFRKSNAFSSPLTPAQIQEAAVQLGQRITPEEAILRIRSIMEQEGLTVWAQSATATGIMFDLIGYRGNQIRAVVDVKHAVHQADQRDQAKVFLDRVQEVHQTAPEVIGCFLADGNVDDDLLELLGATRPFKLLWYDLTKADAMTRLAADLRASLHSGVAGSLSQDSSTAQLSTRKSQNEELMAQLEERIKAASTVANASLVSQLQEQRRVVELQLAELNDQLYRGEEKLRAEFLKNLRAQVEELDRKSSAELQQLYARLEEEQHKTQSRRDREVLRKQEGEEMPKLHATYAELTRPPTGNKKLQLALSSWGIAAALCFAVGGVIMFLISGVMIYSPLYYNLYRGVFASFSVLMVFFGALLFWLRLVKVEAFFDYSARTLRMIYIHSQSIEDLLTADRILHGSLETFGLGRWKEKAEVYLWDRFGGVLGPPPH